MRKLTIEEMNEIAEQRGGKCLSIKYINANTKLEWKCKFGHRWMAKPGKIKFGQWCPKCGNKSCGDKLRGTIKGIKDIALQRGGVCLSDVYIDNRTKLKFKCTKGHVWMAVPNNIQQGQWCPVCYGNIKLTIEEMYNIAKEHGGKCLSKKYVSSKEKLQWLCSKGHKWKSVPNSIKGGHWCPKCGRIERVNKQRLCIEDMQELARQKSGKCLSKEYINAHTKLRWRCEDGHEWKAKPNTIKNGHWCPICSVGVNERICRAYFELIFNKKFSKKRPSWLVNPKTRGRLELDGYCEELRLAFEYNGVQHYTYREYFDKNKSNYFNNLKNNDKLKMETCKKHNVTLIVIPYTIIDANIQKYIIDGCEKSGIILPENIKMVDYRKLDVWSPKMLKEMQKLADVHNGNFLSTDYLGSQKKHKWQCKKGHIWEATPVSVKWGTWCPKCRHLEGGKKHRLTIEEMQKIAEERGGKCLSTEYTNVHTKLKWRCEYGHEWWTTPHCIRGGSWCIKCVHSDRIKRREKLNGLKRKLCYKNNVPLIEVPYSVKYEDMPAYIAGELS